MTIMEKKGKDLRKKPLKERRGTPVVAESRPIFPDAVEHASPAAQIVCSESSPAIRATGAQAIPTAMSE